MQMLKIRSSQDLNLGVLCQMFLLSHWNSGNGAEDSMNRWLAFSILPWFLFLQPYKVLRTSSSFSYATHKWCHTLHLTPCTHQQCINHMHPHTSHLLTHHALTSSVSWAYRGPYGSREGELNDNRSLSTALTARTKHMREMKRVSNRYNVASM